MNFASRMNRLGSESAFEVLARAKALEAQGRDVIHLEIGEPDFETPSHIVEAAIKALREGYTHYTPAAGLPIVRQGIAAHISHSRNTEVTPAQVVITPGAKPIMFFAILALLQPGHEAIYPDPGFPIYRSMIDFVGAVPVPLPLREENQFRFDPDEFRSLVNDRTRLIIINSPQNPTGGVLTRADLEVIADTVRERNVMVLSDEVYEQILYEGKHTSILSLPDMLSKTILLDGFSKTYAMTGWRLGYGVMPEPLAIQIEKLMVNSNSCTAAFTQLAGLAALTGPRGAIDEMVGSFRKRREAIIAGLNEIPGFHCTKPAGAFYAFANVTGTGLESKTIENLLLNSAGVAALDGGGFGQFGTGYIRFSYANSIENIRTALSRINYAIEARQRGSG